VLERRRVRVRREERGKPGAVFVQVAARRGVREDKAPGCLREERLAHEPAHHGIGGGEGRGEIRRNARAVDGDTRIRGGLVEERARELPLPRGERAHALAIAMALSIRRSALWAS